MACGFWYKKLSIKNLEQNVKGLFMYNTFILNVYTTCNYKFLMIINDFKNIIANTCLNIIIFLKYVKTRNVFVILYKL